MAKPNYSFEKRQRELAKKKKKEEKLKEKTERKTGHGPDDASNESNDDARPAEGAPADSGQAAS